MTCHAKVQTVQTRNEGEERTTGFKRNSSLENLLTELNANLSCSDDKFLNSMITSHDKHPVIFVMGPLRSGTTLFMQWLAKTGLVAYPSNFLSRFYGAPITGAKIQQLLTDPLYNFRNEILDFNSQITNFSENGKTLGALSPNEFWYFWQRFLPSSERDWFSDDDLNNHADHLNLVKELSALTQVFNKPFALKGMIMNYNISFLDTVFENAIFVQLQRDPVTNVASVLEARKKQFGTDSEWYSFKIPEYTDLKSMDPVMQAAGQIFYNNKAILAGMHKVSEAKKMVVNYEEFCNNPRTVFSQLAEKLGVDKPQVYAGNKQFSVSRQGEQPGYDVIRKALSIFQDAT